MKVASKLTAKGRKQISEGNFALPNRRYPIHDRSHAVNALARVSQYGTDEEKRRVRRAVYTKYPSLEKSAMDNKLVALLAELRREKTASGATMASTAMDTMKKHQLPLVGAASLAAGGGTGYILGKRKDKKTPYSRQHMNYAYLLGRRSASAPPTKTASWKTKALLATGGAALAGAGYAGGRAHAKKLDQSPYSAQHMSMAYQKGQHDVIKTLQDRMAKRQQTAVVDGTVKSASIKTPFEISGIFPSDD